MTVFFRLVDHKDKPRFLQRHCRALREGEEIRDLYSVDSNEFKIIPRTPFCYWTPKSWRQSFASHKPFEAGGRTAKVGLQTSDNFRFLRLNWEIHRAENDDKWVPYSKGGDFARFYSPLRLCVNWKSKGREAKAWAGSLYNASHWSRILKNVEFLFRPGLTWTTRTTADLSVRAMPIDCAFDTKGATAFVAEDDPSNLLCHLALANSWIFAELISMQLAAADAAARSYDTGVFNRTPVPDFTAESKRSLAKRALRSWSLKRGLDTVEETSPAFLLPAILRNRGVDYDPAAVNAELAEIQGEIDEIAFDLYGFSDEDRQSAMEEDGEPTEQSEPAPFDLNTAETRTELLSWAIGVTFGRFDWRLATGEREPPPEPEPFDPLPAQSPGMLPGGDQPFHAHDGILVDDRGHAHDLTRLIDDVLTRVEVEVPTKLRRWLRKEFFPHHLKQYSKSRRKAPIYWPLSTTSGNYTLWIYYPTLTSQTLYTAVNDFVDPKLKDVAAELIRLRQKGAERSSADEDHFGELGDFASELQDFRTTLLEIAERFRPNQDDGVQITAAPLWPLFRHKPWQKVLKQTWEELAEGKYDWPHLAMAYWPERVVRSAHADRSIAIAHDLEDDLWHEVETDGKRGKARTVWQPRELSDADLDHIAKRFT